MDAPEFPSDDPSPPKKEIHIQGPRPAPLKVRKDSYKIKKPPLAPQPSLPPLPQLHQPQHPRRPVIIYTVSPKVIHTSASDFMTLVQRLTGPNSSSSSSSYTAVSSSSSSSSSYVDNSTGTDVLVSPAARFATIEKANSPSQGEKSRKGSGVDVVEGVLDDINGGGGASATEEYWTRFFPGLLSPVPSSIPLISPSGRLSPVPSSLPLMSPSFFSSSGILSPVASSLPPISPNFFCPPGILSPVPSSFPPISPNFFSPRPDHSSSLAFLQDLSPIFHGNRNFIEGTMVPSPTTFLSSAPLTSPTPFMDLFNQFDL